MSRRASRSFRDPGDAFEDARQPEVEVRVRLGTELGNHGWRAVAWCLGIVAVAIPVAAVLYGRRTTR